MSSATLSSSRCSARLLATPHDRPQARTTLPGGWTPPLALPACQAKKGKDASAQGPQVKLNRLLLRFGTLHEGFAACRTVFRQLCGSEDGELGLEQLRAACTQVGPVGCGSGWGWGMRAHAQAGGLHRQALRRWLRGMLCKPRKAPLHSWTSRPVPLDAPGMVTPSQRPLAGSASRRVFNGWSVSQLAICAHALPHPPPSTQPPHSSNRTRTRMRRR